MGITTPADSLIIGALCTICDYAACSNFCGIFPDRSQ